MRNALVLGAGGVAGAFQAGALSVLLKKAYCFVVYIGSIGLSQYGTPYRSQPPLLNVAYLQASRGQDRPLVSDDGT